MSHSLGSADSAVPLVAPGVGVGAVVSVPARAMSLDRMSRRYGVASDEILASSDGFKVIRPDTSRGSAKVVDVESAWDDTAVQFVAEPMGLGSLSANVEVPVAIGRLRAHPEPASFGLVDSGPESLASRSKRGFTLQLGIAFHARSLSDGTVR